MRLPSERRILLIVALCLAGSVLSQRTVEAVSFGSGPTTRTFYLFPEDDGTIQEWYILAGSTDDNCVGWKGSLVQVPDSLFMSFDRDVEMWEREVYTTMYPQTRVHFFAGSGGVDPADEPDYARLYVKGIWETTGGGGIQIGAGTMTKLFLELLTPQVPLTQWTLTNTSAYDIVDGVLLLNRGPVRYMDDITIPAGGSVTVAAQMAPSWQWSFGGVLDAPQASMVFAFDSSGLSPEGLDITEVFKQNSYYYYVAGFNAALMGTLEMEGTYIDGYDFVGRGSPKDGFLTYFAPPVSTTSAFDLYAFSDGQKVGFGTASSVPEPNTVLLLGLTLAGLLLARQGRGRRPV